MVGRVSIVNGTFINLSIILNLQSNNDDHGSKTDDERDENCENYTSTDTERHNPFLLSSLKKLAVRMEQEHYIEHNVEVSFKVHEKQGKFKVHCSICKTVIAAGPLFQKLQNLSVHTKSKTHQLNIDEMLPSDKKQNKIAAVFKDVDSKFNNIFVLKGAHAVCRDCLTEISLLPAAGDLMPRMQLHVDSKQHKKLSNRTYSSGSKRIESFFKPKPKNDDES